jgi:hypothetical protein
MTSSDFLLPPAPMELSALPRECYDIRAVAARFRYDPRANTIIATEAPTFR